MRRFTKQLTLVGALVAATAFVLPPATALADSGTTFVFPKFVIGDGNAVAGATVGYWGAQWAQNNTVSGGAAPSSFKGFADIVTSSGPCTGTFSTLPGDSSQPPASVGSIIDVLVTSQVTKSGPVISGTYTDIVQVQTGGGYASDPGHPGTGTVIGSLCGLPT